MIFRAWRLQGRNSGSGALKISSRNDDFGAWRFLGWISGSSAPPGNRRVRIKKRRGSVSSSEGDGQGRACVSFVGGIPGVVSTRLRAGIAGNGCVPERV